MVPTKRQAAKEPQSRSKRTRTRTQRAKFEENPEAPPSSPVQDEDEDDYDQAPHGDDLSTRLKQVAARIAGQWEEAKRAQEELAKFRKDIEGKEQDISTGLSDFRTQRTADQESFRNNLIPIMEEALSPIDAAETLDRDKAKTRINVSCTAVAQQKYIDTTLGLIDASFAMIKTYKQLVEREPAPSRLTGISEMFAKDQNVALATIAAGRKVVAKEAESMLTNRTHEVRGRSGLSREDEQQGRLLMSRGERDDAGEKTLVGFGSVAHDVQKAVDKLEAVALKH